MAEGPAMRSSTMTSEDKLYSTFVSTLMAGHSGPSHWTFSLVIIIIITFQWAVQLHHLLGLDLKADYILSITHWLPYSLLVDLGVCPSVSVPLHLAFYPPIFPSLPVSSSVSLCVVGDGCFSWQVKRHDSGFVPVTLHIFPSFSVFLFLSLLWRSILGPWLCVLSSL